MTGHYASLATLTQQFNLEYHSYQAAIEVAQQAFSASLIHAKHCGEHLIEARSQLRAHQWQQWLEQHCHISERLANTYIAIAQQDAPLSPQQQLAECRLNPHHCATPVALGQANPDPHPQPFPWEQPGQFQATCQHCNQTWLAHVFLFEAMEKSVAEIANLTAHPVNQVERALHPDYLDRFPAVGNNDSTAWHSLSIFFGSMGESVKREYEWQRRSLVTFWTWKARRAAALTAAQSGLDCADELQALANAAKRDRDRHNDAHKPSNWLPMPTQDPLFLAIHNCACEDARYAIGFEPVDQFDGTQKPIVLWVLEKMTFFQWFNQLPEELRREASPQRLLTLAQADQAHPWVIELLEASQ